MNKRGEVATLIVIGSVIALGVLTVISSSFINKKSTGYKSRADDAAVTCHNLPSDLIGKVPATETYTRLAGVCYQNKAYKCIGNNQWEDPPADCNNTAYHTTCYADNGNPYIGCSACAHGNETYNINEGGYCDGDVAMLCTGANKFTAIGSCPHGTCYANPSRKPQYVGCSNPDGGTPNTPTPTPVSSQCPFSQTYSIGPANFNDCVQGFDQQWYQCQSDLQFHRSCGGGGNCPGHACPTNTPGPAAPTTPPHPTNGPPPTVVPPTPPAQPTIPPPPPDQCDVAVKPNGCDCRGSNQCASRYCNLRGMYCDDRATPTPVSSCISLGGQCYASSENPNNYAGYTCDKLSASDCNCYSCHKKTDAELTCYERGMYDSVAQCQQSDYGRCTSSYGKTCDVDIATGCAYCHTYASEPTATPTVPASSTHDCEVSCRDKNCKNKPDNQQNDCFQYCSNYCGGSSSAPTATPRPVSKVEKCKSECNGYKDCECHCEGLCYNYSVYVDKCIVCGTPAPYAKQPTATPTPAPESGSGNAPSDGSYDCQYDPVNENYICN